MTKKNLIPYIGFIACCLYFITTAGLIVTGTSGFLVAMELATVLSTPILLLLFLAIPSGKLNGKIMGRQLSIVFMSCCMVLTSVAHFVNLAVTQPLIRSGVKVPTYFQIGQWPSVMMAVDYLGWGFFMGAAFLSASYAASSNSRIEKALKYTLFVCGILCLTGLLGTILIHENLWYIAPMGYGVGTAIFCIELIVLNKSAKRTDSLVQSRFH